jgi:hypothetical protein
VFPRPPDASREKESLWTCATQLEPIERIRFGEKIEIVKTNVGPKTMRELTFPNAMAEKFILDATTGASGRRTHFGVIE